MAATIEIILDCADLDGQARFWSGALGYKHQGSAENHYALLTPPDGDTGPHLILQRVDERKTVKNRVHFDVKVPDIEAEAARLIGLGARRAREEPFDELGGQWIVMSDPEGNEFCVCKC
jgi:predicted enzyme related to lactoylglutathione lyase